MASWKVTESRGITPRILNPGAGWWVVMFTPRPLYRHSWLSKGRFTHSMPCRAAKGLECVFPIWFTQCGHVWFTLAMPCPCHAPIMPFFSRPRHSMVVSVSRSSFSFTTRYWQWHVNFHDCFQIWEHPYHVFTYMSCKVSGHFQGTARAPPRVLKGSVQVMVPEA